jgi:putative spermidine/putrescine transport system permease protein
MKLVRTPSRLPRYWLLALGPVLFLLVFFVVPNLLVLSVSFLKTDAQVLTNELTFDNYRAFFTEPLYVRILLRTLGIAISVGVLVVVLSFPLAYFLARTKSRWQGTLIALALSPLLASVVVRTYGWFVILHRGGVLNDVLMTTGMIDDRLRIIPGVPAIVIGLTHVLLPYGVFTILGSLHGVNPNLEMAAMNLGASRFQTFLRVVLPLSLPGLVGGFLLTFAITISAYATPAILGGPRTETMVTQIFSFMVTTLDWSMGATFGAVLIMTTVALVFLATKFGAKRGAI